MRKRVSIIILSLFAVALLLPVAGVFSTKSTHVVGVGAGPPVMTIIPVKFAGGNTFYSVTGTGAYGGPDLVGTTEGTHRWHENKDGKTNLHLDLVFS